MIRKKDLSKQLKALDRLKNVSYDEKLICALKVGGKIGAVITPFTEDEIIEAVNTCKDSKVPFHIAGNFSNTMIKDDGFQGAVIKISGNYTGFNVSGDTVMVRAGTSLIRFAKEMTQKGFGGLEFAGGIPGTVGGGVFMNAGAFDGQMSDVVTGVKVFNGYHVLLITKEQLEFSYRHSAFMEHPEWIILEVQMKLNAKDGDMDKLVEFNERRAEKQPLDLPNLGSAFKRPKDGFAAQLIEECGLKGAYVGDAQVSVKHSGFIVNTGRAKSKDVLKLVEKIKKTVKKEKGIELELEWEILDSK